MANCSAITTLSGVLTVPQTQNITGLIRECPDLCSLAWGKGNPDLSGIGAYASYILQAILTVIYGPLFHVLYISISDEKWRRRLIASHDNVFRAASILNIAIAIATIVRLKQSAVLYEVTFMYYLTTMQFISIFCVAITAITFPDALDFKQHKTAKRTAIITVSVVLQFGLYIGAIEWIKRSSIGFSRLHELQSACDQYGKIIPGVKYAYKAPPPPPLRLSKAWTSKKSVILWNTLGLPVKFVLGILMIVVTAGVCYLIFLFIAGIGIAFLTMFEALHTMFILNALFTLAFAIGMFYCLGRLVGVRNELASLMGPDWEDNKWGFGQVLAVFIWIPSLFEVLFWAILAVTGFGRKNKPGKMSLSYFGHPSGVKGRDRTKGQNEPIRELKTVRRPTHARQVSRQATLPLLNNSDEHLDEPPHERDGATSSRHSLETVKSSQGRPLPLASTSPV